METFAWKRIAKQETAEKKQEENRIENEYFSVTVRNSLIDIFDKRSKVTYKGLNLLKDLPDAGDVWDYSEPYKAYPPVFSDDFETAHVQCFQDVISQKIEITGTYEVPEKLVGDDISENKALMGYKYVITLWKGIQRIDVKLVLDNKAKDHITFLELPFDFKADSVLSQGAFCVNEREVVPYEKKPGLALW